MLSEQIIQLKAQEYLQYFENSHLKKQSLLKQLEFKVNNSAKKIQIKWKQYIHNKKNSKALLIQQTWKKYKLKQIQYQYKINKFKKLFYGTKIAYFIYQKFFKCNHQSKQNQSCQTTIRQKKYSFSSNLFKYFSSYINLSQTFQAESKYIDKLRVYEKQKFSQSWQKYQQNLKSQLQKQASKKWIRKNQQIWITKQDKQVNLQEYIQKHVEKLFKKQYDKYKQADQKLQNTTLILRHKIKKITYQYYQRMLQKHTIKKH